MLFGYHSVFNLHIVCTVSIYQQTKGFVKYVMNTHTHTRLTSKFLLDFCRRAAHTPWEDGDWEEPSFQLEVCHKSLRSVQPVSSYIYTHKMSSNTRNTCESPFSVCLSPWPRYRATWVRDGGVCTRGAASTQREEESLRVVFIITVSGFHFIILPLYWSRSFALHFNLQSEHTSECVTFSSPQICFDVLIRLRSSWRTWQVSAVQNTRAIQVGGSTTKKKL